MIRQALSIALVFLTAPFPSGVRAGQADSPPKMRTGTVYIQVMSSFGRPFAPARVSLLRQNDQKDFSNHLSVSLADGLYTAADIPHGRYVVQAWQPSFLPVERRINLTGARLYITIGLPLVVGDDNPFAYFAVSGSIAPAAPAMGDLWIKIVSLYSDFAVEAKADSRGAFRADGIPMGNYLLIVMKAADVLEVQSLVLDLAQSGPEKRLSIQLPGRPPKSTESQKR